MDKSVKLSMSQSSLVLKPEDEEIIVRAAEKHDCQEIRRLVQELANYQQMPNGPKIDAKVFEKDGFDTESPLFQAVVAESVKSKSLVGYALFSYLYDCFEGHYLYLEDICVTESFRRKGIGARLFENVVQIGVNSNCSSMIWDVLKWNPAKQFYDKYGATDLTETKGLLFHRVYR